jgi:hypothetical protein
MAPLRALAFNGMTSDANGEVNAADERYAPEWDLARIALAVGSRDPFLTDLIDLAENGIGSVVGVLANGMVAVGSIGGPEVVADALDAERRQRAAASVRPEDKSEEEWDKILELFVTANRRLVDAGREEREEFRESDDGPFDYSDPVRGKVRDALDFETHYNLTLVRPHVVAPGQIGVLRPPFLRVSLRQVAGWWLVPTDEDGRASFQIFETEPS